MHCTVSYGVALCLGRWSADFPCHVPNLWLPLWENCPLWVSKLGRLKPFTWITKVKTADCDYVWLHLRPWRICAV